MNCRSKWQPEGTGSARPRQALRDGQGGRKAGQATRPGLCGSVSPFCGGGCWDLCGLWITLCLCFRSRVCFLGFQPSLINESAPRHPSSYISQPTFTSCRGSSPDQGETGPLALQGWWDLPSGGESHVLRVSLTTHQAFDSVPFPACCITSNQMGCSDEVWRLRVCAMLPGLCVGNSRGIRLTAPGRAGRGGSSRRTN